MNRRHSVYRRHSVWVDVFGVLAIGVVLLAPLVYLGLELTEGWRGGGGGVVAGGDVRGPQAGSSARGRRRAYRSTPLPTVSGSRRPSRRPRGGASAVPFSEAWRAAATPRFEAPSSASGVGEGLSGGRGSPWDGGRHGPGRSVGTSERAWARSGGKRADPSWRAEARALAGRARALSGALGALEREAGRRAGEEGPPARASSSSGTSSTADENPPLPPPVPIDDHLHWLLVVGVIWGAWRLHRG